MYKDNENSLAEVRCKSTNGYGTGYLIAPHLVLTAAHVIADLTAALPAGLAIDVRTIGQFKSNIPFRAARLVWPLPGRWRDLSNLDIALLEIPADAATRAAAQAIELGADGLARGQALQVHFAGFPRLTETTGSVDRDAKQIFGTIALMSGAKRGLVEIAIEGKPARSDEDWRGMSGAAVFAHNRLIAVVNVKLRDGIVDFTAARLDTALTDPNFRVLVTAPRPLSRQFKTIAPDELDQVVSQAQDEGWRELVLLGPDGLHTSPEHLAEPWRGADRLLHLSENVPDLAKRLSKLPSLTSLNLSDHEIKAEDIEILATSLPELTALDLSWSHIGSDGAKAIAANLTKLTSLYLSGNNIGPDGVRSIAAQLPCLTALDLAGNRVGVTGVKVIASKLTKLTSLDLHDGDIGLDGPRYIAAGLSNLTALDLSANSVGTDGTRALASRLTKLEVLNLAANDIGSAGAKAVAAGLPNLIALDLGGNNIGADGAKAIAARLTNLTTLDLADNRVGSDGAKAIASHLTKLTSLILIGNDIGPGGAEAIATGLANLTKLDLERTNIGLEGARAVLDAWSSEQRHGKLHFLDLRNNSDLRELLPKEALETTDAQAILAAYRRFTAASEQKTLRPLNELKLIVVGNEAVGKTSLLRYLIHGKPRDPSERKTPGIFQHEKIEVREWSPHESPVRLNVWDFGGQEMMRGTHRFFLTERSLYLLVLEDRRQDDRSIFDWLKTIRNRGGDSPIIIVINKSDAGKRDLRLDESGLQFDYPTIVGFLRTSCDVDQWAKRSIEKLREEIVETVTRSERLKHVRDPIPANWLRIKDRVHALAAKSSVLQHDRFARLCRRPGDRIEPVNDDNEQRALLRLLHELGTIVAHGLERDAPAARREITLLDPNWLTGAVYRILDKASSADQEGEFARSQMSEWLDPHLYPPERHEFILDMMQQPDIGLCLRLPPHGTERYLMPEALPANRRVYEEWPSDSLRFRFAYGFLPPSLIPRFIVHAHQNLAEGRFRWRTGAVMVARDCDVLVTADLDQRRVDIQVKGPAALRRSALNVMLDHLEAVHRLNPESNPIAVVPLPDQPELHVRYDHLLRLEERRGAGYEFIPEGTDREYKVSELLDGVRNTTNSRRENP